jgi:hypothetical protein
VKIEWNRVTWYSKLIAVIVFLATAFLFFKLGAIYGGANNFKSQSLTGMSSTTTSSVQNSLAPTGPSISTDLSFAEPIFSCTKGCAFVTNVAHTIFMYPTPAPVTWIEEQSEVDVVGAHALAIVNPNTGFDNQVLTLFFRVLPITSSSNEISSNTAPYSVSSNLQMIIDEYGNSLRPITSTASFYWVNDPTTKNQIQTASFIMGTSTSFDFSVDDPSNVLFYVTVNKDRTITIAKEPTAD